MLRTPGSLARARTVYDGTVIVPVRVAVQLPVWGRCSLRSESFRTADQALLCNMSETATDTSSCLDSPQAGAALCS